MHTNGDTNQTVKEVPSKETDARLGTNYDVIDNNMIVNDSLLSLNPKMLSQLEAASETCSDLNVGDPLLNLSPELLAQLKVASEKQKALDIKHQARKRLAQATLRTNEMKAGLVREQHRLIMAELQARLEQAQTQAERNKEVHELELEYLKQQVSLSKLQNKFLAEKLNLLKTKTQHPDGFG
uniref:Uncharacterized protein n=1 Tax=Timema monikensis TaxID=170555 RepID=A0A7R9HU80_9NEOP|nr:unnamed protein product [Timema monikensis]